MEAKSKNDDLRNISIGSAILIGLSLVVGLYILIISWFTKTYPILDELLMPLTSLYVISLLFKKTIEWIFKTWISKK